MEKTSNKRSKAEESKEQIVPVKKSRGPSNAADGNIPMALWDNIVSFLDIPQLGKCAQVSKGLKAVVMKDATWEVHVKKLLRKLFDHAFFIEPKLRCFWKGHTPVSISKRPLKSTNFRAWYAEWMSSTFEINIHGKPHKRIWDIMHNTAVRGRYSVDGNKISIEDMIGAECEFCHWLFEDVPLRSYYKEAGNYAYLGYQKELEEHEEWEDEDPGFSYDYDGVPLGVNPQMFRGLPNIRLFHGLGGYGRRPSWYDDY